MNLGVPCAPSRAKAEFLKGFYKVYTGLYKGLYRSYIGFIYGLYTVTGYRVGGLRLRV